MNLKGVSMKPIIWMELTSWALCSFFGYLGITRDDNKKIVGIVCIILSCIFLILAILLSIEEDYLATHQNEIQNPASQAQAENKQEATLLNKASPSSPAEKKIMQKITDLRDLQNKLLEKEQNINSLSADYTSEIERLKQEIRNEQGAQSIRTYAQAEQNPRIKFDLSLIQRKTAYIDKLNEIKDRLRSGYFEAEYLERQSTDDARMIGLLDSKEAEKLTAKLSTVIAKYEPESGKLIIEDKDLKLRPIEQIWNEISK
jgi:hypothetical protein